MNCTKNGLRNPGFLTICALAALVSVPTAGALAQDAQQFVRAEYSASKELPTQIAFVEFLRLISSVEDEELRNKIVAQAVGAEMVKDAAAKPLQSRQLGELAREFVATFDALKAEQNSTREKILCGSTKAAGAERIFDAMNEADDVDDAIASKFHQTTVGQMPIETRAAFADYLDELKTGISYVKLDWRAAEGERSKAMNESARNALIQRELSQYCDQLASK